MTNTQSVSDSALKTWEPTGLLQGLDGYEKTFCASFLQELCQNMLAGKEDAKPWDMPIGDPFYSLVFPAARVLVGAKHYPTTDLFLKDFKEFYESNKDQIDPKDDKSEPAFIQSYLSAYPARRGTIDQQS